MHIVVDDWIHTLTKIIVVDLHHGGQCVILWMFKFTHLQNSRHWSAPWGHWHRLLDTPPPASWTCRPGSSPLALYLNKTCAWSYHMSTAFFFLLNTKFNFFVIKNLFYLSSPRWLLRLHQSLLRPGYRALWYRSVQSIYRLVS